MRRSILSLLLLCGAWPALSAADTYTFTPSGATGDWHTVANWTVNSGPGHTADPATSEPSVADIVIIPIGKTATTIANPLLPLQADQLTINGTLDLLGTASDGGQLILGTSLTVNGELKIGGENVGDVAAGGSGHGVLSLQSSSFAIDGSGDITVNIGGSFNTPVIEIPDSATIHMAGVTISGGSLSMQQAAQAIGADSVAVPPVVSTMSTWMLESSGTIALDQGAVLALNNGMGLENAGNITLAKNAKLQFDASAAAGTAYFIQDAGGSLDWTVSDNSILYAQLARPDGTLHVHVPSSPALVNGDVYALFNVTAFTSTDYPTTSDFTTITGNGGLTVSRTSTLYNFTVNLASGTVTIDPLGSTPAYGDTLTPTVHKTSSAAVVWSSDQEDVISTTGGVLRVVGRPAVGSPVTLTATVASDGTYDEASDSLVISTINAKAVTVHVQNDTRAYGVANPEPVLTATGLVTGDTIATLGSPLYAYSPSTPGPTTSPGTFTVTVSHLSNPNYAITATSGTLTITKASQTITFAALADIAIGDVLHLSASSSSGLAVTYTSSDTLGATASLTGSTVTGMSAGTLTLTAHQAGNANYLAATNAAQNLTVTKIAQTITFPALSGSLTTGGSAVLAATASSGLTVTYASSNTAVATVSGSTVTAVAAGSATITANQAGNATYAAAPAATIMVTVVAPVSTGGDDGGGGGGGCGAGTGISCLLGLGLLLAFRRR